jgi:hypothetical protein
MASDEQREATGIRQPSSGDAAGGGEAEAAKLAAEPPEDTETPMPDDLTRPSEAATRDIEDRQGPEDRGAEGRPPEDAPAY